MYLFVVSPEIGTYMVPVVKSYLDPKQFVILTHVFSSNMKGLKTGNVFAVSTSFVKMFNA